MRDRCGLDTSFDADFIFRCDTADQEESLVIVLRGQRKQDTHLPLLCKRHSCGESQRSSRCCPSSRS